MAGPVPKRSEHRRRVNKTPGLQKAAGAAHVPVPRADKTWHPIAFGWYQSLSRSGQSQFYEPSDWALAQLVAHQMSLMLNAAKPSALMLSTIMSSMTELLVTEGSRRRMRLELQRDTGDAPDPEAEAEADVVSILAAVADS